MASALPSNAFYDVQKYLRQKRATGAQVTPQSERAAWSGYFDTMEQNSLAERNSAMTQERLDLLRQDQYSRQKLAEKAQEATEGASTWSGVGQGISTLGQGAMLLKGTSLGSKIGLGPSTAPSVAPTTTSVAGGTTAASIGGGAAPTTATIGAGVPTTAAEMSTAAIGGGEGGALVGGVETGMLSPASPYLGPAGVGFATGSVVPNMLGIKNETARIGVGAGAGALSGAVTGGVLAGEIGTVIAPGYGTAVGAIIGAVAGGIGAKVK